MGTSSETMDKWRDYFGSANSDIFGIIEHAIMVAAMDYPQEFQLRRDRIAEILFTCKVPRCSGCNKGGDEKCKAVAGFDRESRSKESKSNVPLEMEVNVKQASNYSYDDAEALTDEIEEQSLTVGEVFRIKKVLDNYQDESESTLFDSLRRLQLMGLTVETLKVTEIGKSVNGLRKHGSKQIKQLVRTLIDDWKMMVDEWVNATTAITESTPESGKASVVEEEDEEEGLPSPPLDEGAFFTTATMDISQFFDGMDFDGNPQDSGEFEKNHENARKPPVRKQQLNDSNRPTAAPRDLKYDTPKKQELVMKNQASAVFKPNTPSSAVEHKLQHKLDKSSNLPKRADAPHQNSLKTSDEDSVKMKLEAAKRKLQERYQEAANAKKQRTVQVMELHDIPKQGQVVHRSQHVKPGSQNSRLRATNGRR
ncbi:unnamed protein product [Cuscuta epithymum]|uniref:TFIIS N-terminal domain-containing protein n=1 Tax=Cuscuta epithymum TaxID=186058 RepID=A0AAV0DPU6_9ASTE|nr:unnamed protein product [Cuscuta epithymum]